jgi:hypothetical protein
MLAPVIGGVAAGLLGVALEGRSVKHGLVKAVASSTCSSSCSGECSGPRHSPCCNQRSTRHQKAVAACNAWFSSHLWDCVVHEEAG